MKLMLASCVDGTKVTAALVISFVASSMLRELFCSCNASSDIRALNDRMSFPPSTLLICTPSHHLPSEPNATRFQVLWLRDILSSSPRSEWSTARTESGLLHRVHLMTTTDTVSSAPGRYHTGT